MKFLGHKALACDVSSLPVRGAWIEILLTIPPSATYLCRSPCGERGLKSMADAKAMMDAVSLPVRGAWIEISSFPFLNSLHQSLPVRGAWIEMCFVS